MEEVFAAAITGNPVASFENHWLNANGEKRLIRWSNTLMADEHEGRHSLITVGIDITDQRLAEERLLESENRLLEVLNLSPVSVYIATKKGREVRFCNARYCDLIGNRNPIGQNPKQYYASDADCEDVLAGLASGKSIMDKKVRLSIPGGDDVWALASYMPINYQGEEAVLSWLYDVTPLFMAEAGLRESLAKLDGLYNFKHLGIVLTDMQGRYVEFNEAFRTLSGYTRDELNRLEYRNLIPKEDEEMDQIESLKSRGYYGPCEKEYLRKDGRRISLRLNGVLIRGGDGKDYIWSVVEDITEGKRLQRQMEIMKFVSDHLGDGVSWSDSEGRLVYVNDAFSRSLGYSKDELLSMRITDFDPDYPAELWPGHWEELKQAGSQIFESRHRTRDGRIMPVEINANYIKFGEDEYNCAYVRDITKRLEHERDLRVSATAFESLDGMMITDTDANLLKVNSAFTRITGYAAEEVIGKNPKLLKSGRQQAGFYKEMWKCIKDTGHWSGEVWNRKKSGEIYPEQLSITAVKDADGRITNYVGSMIDITERKISESKIQQLAYYDQLTGLPNRQLFRNRLEQDMKRVSRKGSSLALLFIDLDQFKEVNDTLGHNKGDALLVEAARRIRKHVREADTFARLGGDEFTIILPEYGDDLCIDRVVQSVLQEMEKPFDLGEGAVGHISCSVGIAVYPQDAESIEDLLKHADQAMYAAKDAGRNRFSYFTPLMQQMAREKLELKNDLRYALSRGEFEVHYQPIVALSNGKIEKAEALLRWNHPRRGQVSPAQFIPLAEEFGIIHELGNWVLSQSIAAVAEWRRLGREVQVSVNRSPVEFDRDDFKWPEMLASAGLPGNAITMEITEGLLIRESGQVQRRLLECRNNGIEVSIDDFGTGYSALSYLKLFDIDYLKIDRSFVQNLTEDECDKALVEAIIVMTHKLGIRTIAEGVETEVQRDLLLSFGCDYVQGFLYSRPVSASEFEKLLNK